MLASYHFQPVDGLYAFVFSEEMEPKSRIKNDFSKLRAQRMQ
jgi:hypothetical protein